MSDLEDGANCTKCGTLTITDAKGICYDCWAENDLKDHETELSKKTRENYLETKSQIRRNKNR